jgi:uncharacterized membrane protein
MKIARIFAISGTLIMFLTLVYGFACGNFWTEGSIMMSMAWGHVSLIDVYLGFAIVGAWVAFRETHTIRAILWIAGFFVLGNFLTFLYIWIQIERSGGDWTKFWFGNRVVKN